MMGMTRNPITALKTTRTRPPLWLQMYDILSHDRHDYNFLSHACIMTIMQTQLDAVIVH